MKDIRELIHQMTLEEKASFCSGRGSWHLKGLERLNIPSIMVTDGPHGVRKEVGTADQMRLSTSVPATCFPTASALAATWDRDLIREVGMALGEECRQEGVSVILGPGANIKRSPLCGRNFEYFSEDPYLAGEIAMSYIHGVQSQGVGTSLKHYAVNNQEHRRMAIDAIVDERALREIYLAGYENAVKGAQPWTVMCAYNQINGTYASDHLRLMREILKDEWGHQGLVVSDWGAMHDRLVALEAGTELEMPGVPNGNDAKIVAAVRSGQLPESVLDGAVERILALIARAEATLSQPCTYDADAHHALARKVAGEGVVLLKNEGHVLPLLPGARVALLGRFAREPRYQGAGSSLMNPSRLDNLHDELIKLIGADRLSYAAGYTAQGERPDNALIQEALDTARGADVVLICAGLTDLYEIEGIDRTHLRMPQGHNALIQAVAQAHANVVVILSNGAPVEMPWANDVAGILEAYLGGQAGAGGVADILVGQVTPSGKLAETFPLRLEDNPSFHCFPGGPATVEYRESIYVGYRYYDSADQDVLFPFGHGLSYTTFAYSDLRTNHDRLTVPDSLTVTLRVRNIGAVAGKEIVQLYVRDVESTAFRPDKELKGFAKVELAPGQEATVSLTLNDRAFASYDTFLGDWHVESGAFEILVGASSRDIRLSTTVQVTSADPPFAAADRSKLAAYYDLPKGAAFSQADFEVLLGRPVPENRGPTKGSHTLDTLVCDMGDSFAGRQLQETVRSQLAKMIQGREDTPNAHLMQAALEELPLRGLLMAGGDFLTQEMLEALLLLINGKVLRGLLALIRASLRRGRSTSPA